MYKNKIIDVVCCVSTEHLWIVSNCIKSLNLYLKPHNIYLISSQINLKSLKSLNDCFSNIKLIDEEHLIPGFKLKDIKNYFDNLNQNPKRAGL